MAAEIQIEVVQPIVRVGVRDDYRVQLRTWEKRTPLTTTQARQLAEHLVRQADAADAALAEDFASPGDPEEWRAAPHGFDIDVDWSGIG